MLNIKCHSRGNDEIYKDQEKEYGPDDVTDPGFDPAEYWNDRSEPEEWSKDDEEEDESDDKD